MVLVGVELKVLSFDSLGATTRSTAQLIFSILASDKAASLIWF